MLIKQLYVLRFAFSPDAGNPICIYRIIWQSAWHWKKEKHSVFERQFPVCLNISSTRQTADDCMLYVYRVCSEAHKSHIIVSFSLTFSNLNAKKQQTCSPSHTRLWQVSRGQIWLHFALHNNSRSVTFGLAVCFLKPSWACNYNTGMLLWRPQWHHVHNSSNTQNEYVMRPSIEIRRELNGRGRVACMRSLWPMLICINSVLGEWNDIAIGGFDDGRQASMMN